MATLNLNKKKSFSEQNMRKIINLIIGLQSSVSEASAQCLRNYIDDGSRTYSKGEICIFNGYVWECKSVTTGAFNPNSWVKLSDEFTQLEKSDIEAMLNLSSEDIAKLSDILLDTEVRLDKGWSSSCIYSKLQQCLEDGKTFTLKEISKLSGASYKVVSATSEMTSESIIYLLPNATNYDMYIVEADGTATRIGNMDVDLSQYFTKTEIETDYLKKTDADGKYATITTVDGKVDKTDIIDNLTSTDTDKPLSANQGKALKDGKIDKTSIATTISSTPSNEKVVSEKAVKTELDKKADKANIYEIKDTDGKVKYLVIDIPKSRSVSGKLTRLFISDNTPAIGLQIWNDSGIENDYRVPIINSKHLYIPPKALTSVSTKVSLTSSNPINFTYTVVNGMCYVNLWGIYINEDLSTEILFDDLPKAKAPASFMLSNLDGTKIVGMGRIDAGTQIVKCSAKLEAGTSSSRGFVRFSYPVDITWTPS